MPHNHEFDCKQCGAHLDSRQDLDRHIRDKHTIFSADSSRSAGQSVSPNQDPPSSKTNGDSRSS